MPPRILCAGCLVVDEIFQLPELPAGDGKFFASERRRALGGMAAAAAATIAALGAKATLWSVIGDDDDGEFLRAESIRLGMQPRLLRRKTATSFSAVCVDSAGRRMIVNRAPSALFSPPRRTETPSLRGCHAVLADVRWPGGANAALRAARKANIPAVLDWETVPQNPADSLRKLARRATHVVFSADGLRQFTGQSGGSRPGPALRMAAEFSGAQVAVTRGENGVVFLRENGAVAAVPAPTVKAKNTLGAGDAFHGALTLALAEGQEFKNALTFAAAAAAAKCAKRAGFFPARREAEKLLRPQRSSA